MTVFSLELDDLFRLAGAGLVGAALTEKEYPKSIASLVICKGSPSV